MIRDYEHEAAAPKLPLTPADAYEQALTGSELFGVPELPWAPTRSIAANAMGLVWPLPPEAADQLRTNGIHAGAVRDTLIVCWLRTLPNASEQSAEDIKAGKWNVQRATRAPREAFDAATEWGIAHKLAETTAENFPTAFVHTLAALLGVSVSEFEIDPPAETNAPGLPTPPDPNA